MSNPETQPAGYKRKLTSSWSVNLADRIAKQVITIGGIGTILVVMLVVLILLANVLPMFQSNTIEDLATVRFRGAESLSRADSSSQSAESKSASLASSVACGVDEYSEIAWVLMSDGRIDAYCVANGKLLIAYDSEGKAIEAPSENDANANSDSSPTTDSGANRLITSSAVSHDNQSLLIGYSDGSLRPAVVKFAVDFVKTSELSSEAQEDLKRGVAVVGDAVLRAMPSGLVRQQRIAEVKYFESIATFSQPVARLDWQTRTSGSSFDESQSWSWAASDGRRVALGNIESQVNSFNGSVKLKSTKWVGADPSVAASNDDSSVIGVMVGSQHNSVQSVDATGTVKIWSQGDGELLVEKSSFRSLSGHDSQPTSAEGLLGRSTMMIGNRAGYIEGVALTANDSGSELLSIHRFRDRPESVKDLAASPVGRMLAVSFDSGNAGLFYVPNNKELLRWSVPEGTKRLMFSANGETVAALGDSQLSLWRIAVPFPEASLGTFFSRLWYEGYQQPQFVWQSSTGSAEGEYKFGLVPLIFGTLKATFYSMLIAAPIALLAAIYGSEFMNRKWRSRVKPVIELMASVPSVVLGFIGALVLAPLLRENLAWVLLSAVAILFFLMLGAHLWLVIPNRIAIRFQKLRLVAIFLAIPFGIWFAGLIAPFVEGWLFETSIIQWLANSNGTGWPGWFCLLLLPMSFLVAWIMSVPLGSTIQSRARQMNAFAFSLLNVGMFLGAALAVVLLCGLSASLLTQIGLDPRGPLLGAYQERNALLVGGILGFAIIPLIYTISEDALQSVPQHLRSASLGCGATTWQTTVRVVVPTAMSGLFSAMMIGFGRAVGETMVVLMAAGNTPVMDINPMNGYRTLSATLATELPEAARGATHYHTLFLAAFLLFCFTLIANTCAEVVRMRFRKRAYQL